MYERVFEALKKLVREDELGNKFIFLKDLKQFNFDENQLSVLFATLKEYDIKVKEVYYEKLAGHRTKVVNHPALDNYLDHFVPANVVFKKLKDLNKIAPTITLDQLLAKHLPEDELKHSIDYIINKIKVYICGISAKKDNVVFDFNVIFEDELENTKTSGKVVGF